MDKHLKYSYARTQKESYEAMEQKKAMKLSEEKVSNEMKEY